MPTNPPKKGRGPGRPRHDTDDIEIISYTELARRMSVKPPTVTGWRKTDKYDGWVEGGVDWQKFRKAHEREIESRANERAGNESKLSQAAKDASDRMRIRKDQIEAGETVYVHDMAAPFDQIAQGMKDALRRMPKTLGPRLLEWMSKSMSEIAAGDPAVSKALSGIDSAAFEREIDIRIDQSVGDLGNEVVMIIRDAIRKARVIS